MSLSDLLKPQSRRFVLLAALICCLIFASVFAPAPAEAIGGSTCPPGSPDPRECLDQGGRYDYAQCYCNMACGPDSPLPSDCQELGFGYFFDETTCSCRGVTWDPCDLDPFSCYSL